jgi:hypothetical protein
MSSHPGYKTTEFWVTTVLIALTQLDALHVGGDKGKGILTALLAIGYALSRGLAKNGAPAGDGSVLPGVPVTDPAVAAPDVGDAGIPVPGSSKAKPVKK